MKKKKYGHLTQQERDRIEALLESGHTQKEIAKILKRNESTISRELKRNRRKIKKKGGTIDGKYEASVAEQKAYVKRKYSKYQGKKINQNKELEKYIIKGLKSSWGPDEISGRMKKDNQPFYASKTAIYTWLYSVYGEKYCHCLFQQRHRVKKRKKDADKTKKTMIPNRIGIEMRPKDVNERKTFNHYESDTIVSGKKTASKESLAVTIERKARYVFIEKIDSLKPELFNQAILKTKSKVKLMETLTMDNGIENKWWEKLEIESYFCDPYSSWQKGGVEHVNGMIRRFIPKGSDLSLYSIEYVKMVETTLNNKPRKSLGYKTPLEVMMENNLFINNI
jgi:transposase, IS30 family